jgi:hypothetical protein
MEGLDAMRGRIQHLKVLAGLTTDAVVLAEINALIRELDRRIHRAGDGADQEV